MSFGVIQMSPFLASLTHDERYRDYVVDSPYNIEYKYAYCKPKQSLKLLHHMIRVFYQLLL